MSSRLIQRFAVATGADTILVDTTAYATPPGGHVVALTAQNWWHAADAAADDFCEHLRARLAAIVGGGSVWTVEIAQVDATIAGVADGRLRITVGTGNFTIRWDLAGSTLPRGPLGWPDGYAVAAASAGGALVSPYVHRYGWYPQVDPWDERPVRRVIVSTDEETTGGYLDADHVRTYDRLDAYWEYVHDPLVTRDYRDAATRMAASNLSTGDEWCSWEQFADDHVRNSAPWRWYMDEASTTYRGPFRLPGLGRSSLREDPLALAERQPRQGGYSIRILGDAEP